MNANSRKYGEVRSGGLDTRCGSESPGPSLRYFPKLREPLEEARVK